MAANRIFHMLVTSDDFMSTTPIGNIQDGPFRDFKAIKMTELCDKTSFQKVREKHELAGSFAKAGLAMPIINMAAIVISLYCYLTKSENKTIRQSINNEYTKPGTAQQLYDSTMGFVKIIIGIIALLGLFHITLPLIYATFIAPFIWFYDYVKYDKLLSVDNDSSECKNKLENKTEIKTDINYDSIDVINVYSMMFLMIGTMINMLTMVWCINKRFF